MVRRDEMSGRALSDESLSLGYGKSLPSGPRPLVHEHLAELSRTHGAHTAVQCGDNSIDYGTLDAWAGRIATRLAGIGAGDRVGVLAEPSTAMVAAAVGVLRTGAAYVPVDLANPDRRVTEILTDARVAAAVVTGGAGTRLAGLDLPLVQVDEEDAADTPGGTGPRVPVTAGDAAYLIYTSGSTGEPKGVLVEHGQLAASTLARRSVYPGAPVFLLVSPLAFDSSAAGVWGTLTAGGRLVVAAPDEIRDPERLVNLVDRHRVTRLLCVPSLYGAVLDAADRLGADRLASLDTVIVAGEPLPQPLVKRHFAVHPGTVALVNEYGPTEATVWASFHRFDAPTPVSIGGPIPGARLYVMDESLRPVPRGVEGELYIGGTGVARGYFGRPAATAEVFLGDPYASAAHARMFRTGDRVRWNSEGTLDFIGRHDDQVKIRGHRVEIGAVETVLRDLPGIGDAAVVPDGERTRLIAFVVAEEGTVAGTVREYLADRLPAAMVPARVHSLESLPRMVNGKVDRGLLRSAADGEGPALARLNLAAPEPESAPPSDLDGTTANVIAAWAEVLKRTDIPLDANFFDLGGHSVAMFQLQTTLERYTGVRPSVVALFQHATVAAQVALVKDGEARSERSLPNRRQAAARHAQAIRARRQQRRERESTT